MRVRTSPPGPDIEEMLGAGGNVEIVPLLVPMATYELILNKASEEGCTAAEVLSRALLQYFAPKAPEPEIQIYQPAQTPKPVMVMKKRR